ncbi:uncharacterized protein LOC126890962 [Diabrotica virgifera virgifera]|uniref:Reverse transcriptase domain-containing protein n=1 Tax=Diabrotica virgifera virgifera TaxID=50390 RepID=A0ABM5L0Y1_DIAVI|nr:uncharacterized protein LOC126890962 [Diabrotica virgifera virgifera]
MGGDFNIDMLDVSERKTVLFSESIDSFNLKQLINKPTRDTRTTSTLLDLILVTDNTPTLEADTIVIPEEQSDHFIVYCSLKEFVNKSEIQMIYRRNLKDIDLEYFQNLLLYSPFFHILNIPDVTEKVLFFNSILTDLFDFVAPSKLIKIQKNRPPWLTDNIQLIITLRNKAFTRCKRTKNLAHWNYYKTLRNQANIMLRNEKKSYLEVNFLGGNLSKIMWKKFNQLNINSTKKNNILPEFLNRPNEINSHFLSNALTHMPLDPNLLYFYNNNVRKNFSHLFKFETVGEIFVYQLLLEIKSKSTGSDLLTIDMILMCCPFIVRYVTDIINTCLANNVFPDAWKIARVLPIPKIKEVKELGELRPISLLPVLSKVLEKIMYLQIKSHLDKTQLLRCYKAK